MIRNVWCSVTSMDKEFPHNVGSNDRFYWAQKLVESDVLTEGCKHIVQGTEQQINASDFNQVKSRMLTLTMVLGFPEFAVKSHSRGKLTFWSMTTTYMVMEKLDQCLGKSGSPKTYSSCRSQERNRFISVHWRGRGGEPNHLNQQEGYKGFGHSTHDDTVKS